MNQLDDVLRYPQDPQYTDKQSIPAPQNVGSQCDALKNQDFNLVIKPRHASLAAAQQRNA